MEQKASIIARWKRSYRDGKSHWENRKNLNAAEFAKMLGRRKSVLDLGCGSGKDTYLFHKKGLCAYGMDISPDAIKKAKRVHKGPVFAVGDVTRIPFQTGLFDAVYSAWVMRDLPFERVAKDVSRVLRPRGIVYLAFHINRTDVSGKFKVFVRLADILSAFRKAGFKLVRQKKYIVDDTYDAEPHVHDAYTIIFKKK